jgi:hypothetical protein
VTENILKILASQGEMKAQELLVYVPRVRGDYFDFYPVAALLHAGYISTDSTSETSGKIVEGTLGRHAHETAVMLCQLALPSGKSFEIDKCPRDSWHDFPLRMFMTSEGYLRLDELEQRRIERKRKRTDYFVSLGVAILAAVLSSSLAHYFASKRLQREPERKSGEITRPVNLNNVQSSPTTAP